MDRAQKLAEEVTRWAQEEFKLKGKEALDGNFIV
jgi:hypothetical protein